MQAFRHLQQLDVRELLTIAIHETGHLWAAQQLGCTGLRLSIEGARRGRLDFTPPKDMPAQSLRLIGLAGLACEMLAADHHLRPEGVVRAAAADDWRLSREDRALCGAVDLVLAGQCIELLQANLGGIRQYAVAEVDAYLKRLHGKGRR